ncbi:MULTISPECIES: S-layer protein [unclassified Haloferax]|uniref:Ig-like domain-containing protein n=1 Tax=unclassified Haloferax TaxID=2625095 RepID=UPI002875A784|nr:MULTISPECIES: S-layer protein [unclassified Haloferax]MDS0243571.1 S-layer protein [Haloferax sp. S2CR25]MDS0446692.1 S-layer protein [Haloferax sp. S2CR25-2]
MSRMPKIWDDSVVRDYLTPEAHQKSREQFLKTHIDIDKIRADYLFPHEGTDEFVTQEEFRDAILKSKVDDDNRIFILRGETGSGKSQLCQWLEYQIGADPNEGDETHIALHVSRSKTGIGDILDIISGPIDTDVTVSNVSDLDPEKVADAIITTLQAFGAGMEQFSKDEIDALTVDRSNAADLSSILEKNIAEYQESATSEGEKRMSDLITKKDYRDLSMAAFGSTKGSDTLFPALQSQVHEILSRNLGVEDFQGKLEELSEEYEKRNLRPVLICEDLTTFTVLKEQLLDHIFQLDSGHYDVVLGWTSGWEKDDLSRALGTSQGISTYMEDRAEGYLSTTDEDGRAYFLDDDLTVKLARKYMSVILDESDMDESLADGVLESFDSLYPFNETFIEESYNHLVQDGNKRRTPRLLLMRVIRECLSSTVPPFDAIEDNPYVEPFPSPVDLSYTESLQRLGKWYGSATTDRQLRVHRQIPETFDVPLTDVDIDDDWAYFQADVPAPTLNLGVSEGTFHPGEYITLRATLDNRGEEDVTIRFNGSEIATTDSDGFASVRLPNEKGDITFQAEKDGETDATAVTVVEPSDDTSISVTVNPKTPAVSDEVTVTARVNGEPRRGVRVSIDDNELGETRSDGKIHFNAPDTGSATVEAVYGDACEETTIDIESSDIHIPVGTDLDSTTVKEYLLQYRNWIKVGDTYDSSTVLRKGTAGVLNEWHDPTLLGNLNARNDGVHGIYYTRGADIPVTIVGADERQGMSFELDFGVEYDDIYEPLFWYGISESGEFPQEDKYDLNYDLLRAWTDKQVADFRAKMRADLEACIDPMTLEEFTVLAQFLILNAKTGRREIEADMMFEKPPEGGFIPGAEDEQPSALREATLDLLKSRNAPYHLSKGLFLLKSNVVDRERLSKAVQSVSENLDQYLLQAMQIDTADFSSAYQISTTRSTGYSVDVLFDRVKDYATTLDDVSAEQNAVHVTEAIERVTTYYEPSHDRDDLHDALSQLHDVLDKLDASKYESWKEAREAVAGDAEIDLGKFRQRMRTFEDISDKHGYELIATLHDYEESRAAESAWEIYEAIAEMIEEADGVTLPEDVGFRDRVRDLSEFETYEKRRHAIETTLGGN